MKILKNILLIAGLSLASTSFADIVVSKRPLIVDFSKDDISIYNSLIKVAEEQTMEIGLHDCFKQEVPNRIGIPVSINKCRFENIKDLRLNELDIHRITTTNSHLLELNEHLSRAVLQTIENDLNKVERNYKVNLYNTYCGSYTCIEQLSISLMGDLVSSKKLPKIFCSTKISAKSALNVIHRSQNKKAEFTRCYIDNKKLIK